MKDLTIEELQEIMIKHGVTLRAIPKSYTSMGGVPLKIFQLGGLSMLKSINAT